ncbi:hypothetical protein NPIL_248231 [Nephila pilipes]|uniref:Secreted protein n=1 Tax=Nephila pilipes TaxID=299642 RepID=A0A8X6PIA5_NEPPI|nr:hypothetical protein NPIL_248231 [Nephila pilipes]
MPFSGIFPKCIAFLLSLSGGVMGRKNKEHLATPVFVIHRSVRSVVRFRPLVANNEPGLKFTTEGEGGDRSTPKHLRFFGLRSTN